MRIVHSAPFAPNACGLYESSRDMVRADCLSGHAVSFVDSGVVRDGQHNEGGIAGLIDDRAGFKLKTAHHSVMNKADLIILHTGVIESWYANCQAPIIWVVHGRPKASFLIENQKGVNSYSSYHLVAQQPRVKKMMYFWAEFACCWLPMFNGKDVLLNYPVIDEQRFRPFDSDFKLQDKGEHNFLICDTEREDVSLFEMINSLTYATGTGKLKGCKFHFAGLEFPLKNSWNILLNNFKKTGCLGDLYPRIGDMEKLYNVVDCVISPNKIITRVIGESLSCGTGVISQTNNHNTISNVQCDLTEPTDTLDGVLSFLNNKLSKSKNTERANVFSMANYSNFANRIYKECLS